MEVGERQPNNEKIGNTSEIDLSNVEISYWSDEEIGSFFEERLKALEDPTGFIEANRWQFDNFKRHRTSEEHSDQEMIDLFIQRERYMSTQAKEKAVVIKQELEGKEDLILDGVQTKLKKYLPDWQTRKTRVTFKIMEDADYRHPRKGEVEVDLWSLTFQKNIFENVVGGITHELFHEWMNEDNIFELADDISIEDGRRLVRAKTVDEGLAVMVGEQSLKSHYEEQGKDYNLSTRESFQYFRDFCSTNDFDNAKSMYLKGFKNMGPFYVVGNEIAVTVCNQIGIERFREIVAGIRENPESLYEEYKKICVENKDLLTFE